MKNAAKGNVRCVVKLFLLTLMLIMMSFVTASAEDKMTGTGNFYYQRNGNEVVISNSGELTSENGGTIFIACYDGEVLDCVKLIKADANIDPFYVREFTMKLSDDVKNLKVKAFAWDSASAMTPLCDAKDIISVKYYATAVVNSIIEEDSGIKIIGFKPCSFDISTDYLEINPQNSDIVYVVEDTDGNAMLIDDIRVNDVLTIAYTNSNGFEYSDSYEIIVSRNIVEGYVTGAYKQNGTQYYTIDGKDYKLTNNVSIDSISVGSTYRLYLDKDGNIAKSELLAVSVNYAVIDKFFTSAGDQKVRLILKDGTKADYVVKANGNGSVYGFGTIDNVYDGKIALVTNTPLYYDANTDGTIQDTEIDLNRIVSYTVNNSDEVTLSPITTAVAVG